MLAMAIDLQKAKTKALESGLRCQGSDEMTLPQPRRPRRIIWSDETFATRANMHKLNYFFLKFDDLLVMVQIKGLI